MLKIKRAYEPASRNDGYRVLVDRLWPRGIKKEMLPLDEWAKELAPSTGLRKSFGHDPSKWDEFRKRFRSELRSSEAKQKIAILAKKAKRSTVTLIYSASDSEHNDAVLLSEVINRELKKPGRRAARKAA